MWISGSKITRTILFNIFVDQYFFLLIQIKNIQKQYYAPTESRARKAGAAQMHKKNTTSRHTNNSKRREKKLRQKKHTRKKKQTYKVGDHRGGHPSARTPQQNTY